MKRGIFLLAFISSSMLWSQENEIKDSLTVSLEAAEIIQRLPVTTEKISKQALAQKNLGQDIASLLQHETSVVTTSDAGAGIGYSGIRIRGVAQDHINITMNGVPLNDPESQNVFWVNMPDLASGAGSVLIQRGVGTTSAGSGAFGAVMNVESARPAAKAFFETADSWGSFNTQKYTFKGGTGRILNDKLRMDMHFSRIYSDGYIDRAFSDLYSYGINAQLDLNAKTSFRYWNFNGREKTYQAWNGIDENTLKENRRFNPAGAIYDENGNISGYYDNETDNYRQNHHHLSWDQRYGKGWKSEATLYYTRGKGYYENYKQNATLYAYKLESEFEESDLVRQKWLDNHFYGINFNIENRHLGDFRYFGGFSVNRYENQHFGKVIWVKDFEQQETDWEFYRNHSEKNDLSIYSKATYALGDFELFADMQYRFVSYKTQAAPGGENEFEDFFPFSDNFHFFNPKAGFNYFLNRENSFYFYYGMAHREPIRSDYLDKGKKLEPEKLHDFELGYKKSGRLKLNVNLYYMYYLNQLTATGQLSDTGSFIRTNSGKSYRAGLELGLDYAIVPEKLRLFGNLTASLNKNLDYFETKYDENGEEILVHYGDTTISFSPNWIGAIGLEFQPVKSWNFNLNNKYVGSQYLANTEPADGKLKAYFISDLLIQFFPKWKNLEFSLLVNNIFDRKYESNGFYYEGPYYYPQAGINVLGGFKLRIE